MNAAHNLDGRFEPEAKEGCSTRTEAALTSIAVSLKRLADVAQEAAADAGAPNTCLGLFGRIDQAIEKLDGVLSDRLHDLGQTIA